MELIIGLGVLVLVGYVVFFRNKEEPKVSPEVTPYKVETPEAVQPQVGHDMGGSYVAPVAEVAPTPVAEVATVAVAEVAPVAVAEVAPAKAPRKPRAPKAEAVAKPAAKKAAVKKPAVKKPAARSVVKSKKA